MLWPGGQQLLQFYFFRILRSCDDMILFHSGCHEFALSKIVLHVHIQNVWIWKPFTMFCASNIALKWQKSTEHNNAELENSSSTQKNVSLFSLIDLIMIMVTLFWLLIVVFNNFVAIFNKLLGFYVQCVDFCIQ